MARSPKPYWSPVLLHHWTVVPIQILTRSSNPIPALAPNSQRHPHQTVAGLSLWCGDVCCATQQAPQQTCVPVFLLLTLSARHCLSKRNCTATNSSTSALNFLCASCSAEGFLKRRGSGHSHQSRPCRSGCCLRASNTAESSIQGLSTLNLAISARSPANLPEVRSLCAAFCRSGCLMAATCGKSKHSAGSLHTQRVIYPIL